jgi:hypothetical protein
MTKMSSFKGFLSTKEAGETFIMDKAAFLLYLAHKKRVEDTKSIIKTNKCGSLIDLVFSEDKFDHETRVEVENVTDLGFCREEGDFAQKFEVMIDVKASPERVLRLLNSIRVSYGTGEDIIGAFCSHSEGSYILDGVID